MTVKKHVVVSMSCELKETRSFGRDESFENNRDEIIVGFSSES